MLLCNRCHTRKTDDYFLKFNRDGNKIPARICKSCRDKRVAIYNKEKLIRHGGYDWTLNMDLRSGRRLTMTRRVVNNKKKGTSSTMNIPTPFPLPPMEAARLSPEDMTLPDPIELSHSLPMSPIAIESAMT